jgi:hypothetical protein
MVLPLFGLIVYKLSKGLITISSGKEEVRPSIALTLVSPTFVLALRVLLDYSILSFDNFWVPFVSLTVVLLLLSRIRTNKEEKSRLPLFLVNVVSSLFMVCVYSYGAVIVTNSMLDSSRPIRYETKVLDKRISRGKSTTYYLKLNAWGPRKKSRSESVHSSVYEKAEIGDLVAVYLFKGGLNIPYYKFRTIRKKEE